MQLAQVVIDELKKFDRPVILIGESFGGLLACYIASTSKALVAYLVLVNPATSYDRTLWQQLGPLVTGAGPAFPVVGLATLFATVVQPDQFTRIGGGILDRIVKAENRSDEANKLLSLAQGFLSLLPPETVEWRLTRWLHNGNRLMAARFGLISTPTLLLIGVQDRLLPSDSEGYRLERLLSGAAVEVREFRRGGHALLDDSMDLLAVLRASRTLGPPREAPPLQVPLPSPEEVARVDQTLLRNFVGAFSPVFLSRDAAGRLQRGIDNVPVGGAGRPVLLIGNHQLYGLDTPLIIREFLQQRSTLVRGLAHPVLFQPGTPFTPTGAPQDSPANLFSLSNVIKFGGVEVSPGNIFKLMQLNETILLFPGGANELCHGKGEAYKVKWGNATDFVRMAAAFDAIIVPFGAVGVADSVNMLLDGEEIRRSILFGNNARR